MSKIQPMSSMLISARNRNHLCQYYSITADNRKYAFSLSLNPSIKEEPRFDLTSYVFLRKVCRTAKENLETPSVLGRPSSLNISINYLSSFKTSHYLAPLREVARR